MTDLVEVIAQLTNERFFTVRACQQSSISRKRIEGAKESKPLHEITNKRIDGNHAFSLQFAERDMYRPLIRSGRAEAIKGQIGAFPNAHAGVANQQKSISAQIVAAAELLLQELVLRGRKRAWESLWQARNVFGTDPRGEFRTLFHPCQFVEDAARARR